MTNYCAVPQSRVTRSGCPDEGLNLPINEMLKAHTEYKIKRGWRVRDPVSGKWSDCMKKGVADRQIWDDSNERTSIAEDFEIPIIDQRREASWHPLRARNQGIELNQHRRRADA